MGAYFPLSTSLVTEGSLYAVRGLVKQKSLEEPGSEEQVGAPIGSTVARKYEDIA